MIELTLGRSLRLAAERSPDKIAVRCGEDSLTHGEINRWGNRLANGLRDAGFRKGDRVGIIMPNTIEYLACVYAAAKSGIVLVFMNYRFTGRDIAYQLKDSGAKALIYGDEFADAVAAAREELPAVRMIASSVRHTKDIATLKELADTGSDAEPSVNISEHDIVYLGYTSGTTGFPKGAIVTHRNRSLAYRYWAIEYGFNGDDRYLQSGPFHHSVQVGFTLAQLSLGGTATVLPKFDPLDAVRVMKDQKITWSFMVPFMYNAILALPERERRREDLESLRVFISAASPLPTGVKNNLLEAFPHVGLHEFYGATEAGVVTNLRPNEQRGKIRCVGKPILDMEVKVLNDTGNEVPPGEVGLLYMKGPTLFDGYYGSPEKTAAAFKDGWCTLGDLARLDEEGYLYIVDRQKDVIKSGGVNIFPAEIEEVLMLHPQVFEAVAVGVPDQKWGEAVHAIIVPKSEQHGTPDDLLNYCRDNLAGYKVPKSLEFRQDLPRNPGGKVLKRVLRDEFWKDHEVRV